MRLKKLLTKGIVLAMSMSLFAGTNQVSASAATVTSIPNTNRSIKNYDKSFLSVTGFASVNNAVKDRSSYIGTSYYRSVSNPREFLQAVLDAQSGSVKVIEIKNNLNLGWKELNLSSAEQKKYTFISKYEDPTNGYTNPNLQNSGASKLNISNTNGLTIFSTSGKTIKHVEFKLQSSSNDIIFRNLSFDEMWQWDDSGNHKEVGWTFIKVNGANNVWVDHCNFSIAADGMVDFENGSSGITFSWCNFGLAANENPSSDSAIYASINYMENQYKNNKLNSNSRYYKLRSSGASMKQIMAFSAYHSKCHLVGSGDKDFMNYVDSNGKDYKDGNQRLKITLAYCHYNNVGQRVPMIRQGVGHMFNCYVDDSSHMNLLNSISAIKNYGSDNLARCINARNGASIAADTCVFNGVVSPIVGAECQGDDTSNMNSPWDKLFANAYNHALIVNSQVTNSNGSYTGSSWDNNGNNLFTQGFVWKDKSTVGKWAWSSTINGLSNMSKSNPPSTPFTFTYNYNENLPYTYNVVSLDNVVSTLNTYGGAGRVSMSASDWLKTSYSSSSSSSTDSSSNGLVNNGIYSIENVNSKLSLDVAGGVAANGTNIQQWGNGGSYSSYNTWKVVSAGNGYYYLVSQVGDKNTFVLDVTAGRSANRTNIELYTKNSSNAQLFKIVKNSDDSYRILTKVSNDASCVEIKDGSTASGANVQEFTYTGHPCQHWKFIKVG